MSNDSPIHDALQMKQELPVTQPERVIATNTINALTTTNTTLTKANSKVNAENVRLREELKALKKPRKFQLTIAGAFAAGAVAGAIGATIIVVYAIWAVGAL